VYNLPKMQDILLRHPGYAFFSKLDTSMQYDTFRLDVARKDFCLICKPFRNYRYSRLPMGVNQSPDVAQAAMKDLFQHFGEVEVYLDDIRVFSTIWEAQFVSLTKVLAVLERHNFTVNPRKCGWETDWIG
jgi:hypothetical protein